MAKMRFTKQKFVCFSMLLAIAGCGGRASDYLKKGNELYATGNYKEAVLNYRKAVQKEPKLGEAYYRLALALSRDGDKKEAHAALTRAVAAAPDLVDAKVKLADLELEGYLADPTHPRVRYDEVKKISNELMARDPRSVDGLRFQGTLALIDRRPDEALVAFRAANEIEPLKPELVRGLMQSLSGAKQNAEAEKLGLALIAKDKTYGLVYDDLYALYRATGRPTEAERIFQTKVANNPSVAAYRLQLAAHFINHGKKAEMEAALRPLRDDAKTFPKGRLDIGQFYTGLGMWDEARTVLEEAQTDPSNRLVAGKRLVQVLVGLGRESEALQSAEQSLKDFPGDSEIRLVRASLWLGMKDETKTRMALQELEQIRSAKDWTPTPMFLYVQGRAHQQTGDSKKAVGAYQAAIAQNPGFIPALSALTKLYLAGGEPSRALEYATRAVEVKGNDPELKLLRAMALLRNRRLGEARSELTALIRANPQMGGAQLQLGQTLAAEKRYEEAKAVFQKLYRPGQPDLRPMEGLAVAYAAMGQQQRAIDLMNSELKRTSRPNAVRAIFGRLALLMNKPDIAIEQYKALTLSEPKVARNHYMLAEALRANGDSPAAIASLEKAERLDPNDPATLSTLATLLQGSGRSSEAVGRLRRVLELRPDATNTMNELAYALAETGVNLEEARQLAQKALQAAPNQAEYADTLGWIYLKTKMTDSALQVFQNLVKKDPKNPVYLYHLAVAQLQKGQKAEGRATLDVALRNRPWHSLQMQIRDTMARGD